MLDLSLFRKPAFNGVSIVAFGLSAGMFAMFLYLTLYIQGVLGYSPLEAGLRFLPLTVLSFVVAPIAGALSNRVPIRVAASGIGLTLVGLGLLLMHGIESADSTGRRCSPASSSPGSASGSPTPGSAWRDRRRRRPQKSGMGSGINTTFRQVGIATGVAALGAIFQSQIDSKLAELLPQAPPGLGELGRLRAARSAARGGARREFAPEVGRRRRHRLRQRLQRDPPDRRRDRLFVGAVARLRARPRPRLRRRSRAPSRAAVPAEAARRAGSRLRAGANPSAPAAKKGACCASCGSRTCC